MEGGEKDAASDCTSPTETFTGEHVIILEKKWLDIWLALVHYLQMLVDI